MFVRISASYHINTSDGGDCKKIFQTRQANVRTVVVGSDAVCNSRLFGVFPDTVIITGTMLRHQGLPPRCLSILKRGFPLFPYRYSKDARQTTCVEASSAHRRHGQDHP